VCHHHEYRRVPSVPDSARNERTIHLFASGRDDLRTGCVPHRFVDFHPTAWLLLIARKRREADRRTQEKRLRRGVFQIGYLGHSSPVDRFGRGGWCSSARRTHRQVSEASIFSEGPFTARLHRRSATRGRLDYLDGRNRARGGKNRRRSCERKTN